MTAVHHYTLRCDHEGCASTFTTLDRRAGPTRVKALARGWSTRSVAAYVKTYHATTVDLCPVHGDALRSWLTRAEYPEGTDAERWRLLATSVACAAADGDTLEAMTSPSWFVHASPAAVAVVLEALRVTE